MNKDRTEVFQEKIVPLMGVLSSLCKEHGVPYVAAFQVDLEETTELILKSYLADPEDSDRLHMMIDILEHDMSLGPLKLELVDTQSNVCYT